MSARSLAPLFLLLAWPSWAAAQASKPDQTAYYPEAAWQHKTPAESGFNPQRLQAR